MRLKWKKQNQYVSFDGQNNLRFVKIGDVLDTELLGITAEVSTRWIDSDWVDRLPGIEEAPEPIPAIKKQKNKKVTEVKHG
ncbi:MAG: hypothetical protein WC347_01050 [Smithellaceae bacterium]|jgi:hypothetical protein